MASGAIAFVLFVLGPGPTWIGTGLIIFGWGVVVALNVRGVADAMPRRSGVGPFWTETSPAMIRFIFAFFALWGAVVTVIGATHLH